ncbi:MAG: 4Fe-4S binding protein [Dehalococcoidia bacterium]
MSIKCRVKLDECINCGACLELCPLSAITADPYYINPDICDGCLACIDGCPTEAIEQYEFTPPNLGNGSGSKNGVTLSLGIGIK